MTTQKQLNKELLQELKQVKSELLKYKQDFEIEKNIKNGLYFFILTNDLVESLKEFRKMNDYHTSDYHLKSLDFLIDNLA